MNNSEFITVIEDVVSTSAIEDTIDNLESPPGRKPDENLVKQSAWFNSLSDSDKNMVKNIISDAVNESVFGFLCVLDGVRSISDSDDSNKLKLTHGDTLLNDIENQYLHDLYKNV
ncbi:hypothetical protein AB4155_08975 [Vibrio splendidus]